LCYAIVVSGEADVSQFDKLHRRVIASSPNRWLLSQNMVLEGDLIVE